MFYQIGAFTKVPDVIYISIKFHDKRSDIAGQKKAIFISGAINLRMYVFESVYLLGNKI